MIGCIFLAYSGQDGYESEIKSLNQLNFSATEKNPSPFDSLADDSDDVNPIKGLFYMP